MAPASDWESLYQAAGSPDRVLLVEFKNDEKTRAGLGIPLPKGMVRVFQRDLDNELEFAGAESIDHTPKEEQVRFRLGYAFDLVAQHRTVAERHVGRVAEYDMEVRLRNHKTDAVAIDVLAGINGQSNWEMVKHSHDFTKRDVNTLVFPIEVKQNAEVVLTYTIRYTW